MCGSAVAPSPEPRARRRVRPCPTFMPHLPAGSPRLHPGGGRRAPQQARVESLSACFEPRDTPRRAAVLSAERASCLGHLCSGLHVMKVSCREGFHTRATAVRTPAPKATASPRRCPFALARDAAAPRCGASTPRRATRFCGPAFAPCVIFAGGSAREPWAGRTLASLGQGHAVVNSGTPLLGDVPCVVDCFPGSRSSCRACVPRAGVEARAPWRPSQAHPTAGTERRAPARARRCGAAHRVGVGDPAPPLKARRVQAPW
jgi:hypothetical protein